ncbi:MAG: M1 family metallopeptidase [Patescibacteria group bacterium]
MKKETVRLSKNVVPIEYDLQLQPDLENFTFEGIEIIKLSVLKATKTLTLHSKGLEIETVEIATGGKKTFAKISYNEQNETVTFLFPKIISTGRKKLTLVFRGILNDKMRGFYRSCYFVDGKECHMATTQFEATDARRAFPCFDEPAHKAVFHISLIVPKGKTSISNTLPISIREHGAGYEIVKFAPTPKMSTYLLAFIVGDFEFLEKKSNRGVLVRVYTTPGKKHQAKFALDVTVQVLEFYEKYFNIPYPLNTLDMIAIPDFTSLAMENWGAITFREVGLLVDEIHTSVSTKELVAEVIAHELAHQWFGNLVTMEWWTHLWLNEGFASYIPYLAIDKLFPQWNIWERFTTDTLGIALRLDALKNTHPVEIEVHHPSEIGEIFDAVSYSKGASIIRMLANYLGEKDFRDGLRYYLKKHSYKNTETVHLWQAFAKVSKKPVAQMMKNWTSQPGYPVVKARMINKKINFSQNRFFASPLSAKRAEDKMHSTGSAPTEWKIPIIFKKNKVNFGETGFFRTAYSKDLLEKLREPIQNKKLSAPDRLGVIRDLFALAEAGIISTTEALEFVSSYKNETNYTVWVELATGLARLEQILHKNLRLSTLLEKFICDLFSPLAENLGWNKKEGELHTDILLRSLAISRAGRSGDKKIITEAKKRFNKLQRGGHINPDIRGAIYTVVASSGGIKEYKILIKKYKKETLHEEKNRIGDALGDFKNPKILEMTCVFSISKDVRPQDTVGIISAVGLNASGRNIWWNFIRKNWKMLVSRYGDGGHTLSRLIKAIGGSAEEKHLKSFKKFFTTHPAPGAKRSVEQVLERLEGNVAWLKRDQKIIEKFLKENK